LAILSGKYIIPEDNPYGEGLVELLDRMLTADSKARADMTEVILCLSAVYSGRPLPPRKRSSRASKTETQEAGGPGEAKADESKDDKMRIGSYRTDGQGIQQPVYDPTKATEGKKLASNSVAARRKRAAAAHLPPAAAAAAPSSATVPSASSMDPLDFSSFGGEGKDGSDAFGADVGFGEMQGTCREVVCDGWTPQNSTLNLPVALLLLGFDTKGGENENEFFGSFAKTATSSATEGNDAFDASAFDAGAWGDAGPPAVETTTSAGSEDPPADSPAGSDDPPETGTTETGEKGDTSDTAKKDRSRRRRVGGSTRSNRAPTGIEAGVEAMNVGEGGDSSNPRRSRQSRPDDTERRSGSRNRRKPRSSRGDRAEGSSEDLGAPPDKDKMPAPARGSGFKKMFKTSAPDP